MWYVNKTSYIEIKGHEKISVLNINFFLHRIWRRMIWLLVEFIFVKFVFILSLSVLSILQRNEYLTFVKTTAFIYFSLSFSFFYVLCVLFKWNKSSHQISDLYFSLNFFILPHFYLITIKYFSFYHFLL